MQNQQGFSYVIAMFLVAVLAIVAVRALENSLTAERREKETELLVVGMAYRAAIKDYYDNTPGTLKLFPDDLDALLLDKRPTVPRRPLRKLFRDPITGNAEWGLIKNDEGKVTGVFSMSTQAPMQTSGFVPALASFEGARQYIQWRFVYQPN